MITPLTAKGYLARALANDKAGREAKAIPDYEQALKLGLDSDDERIALICMASSHRSIGEYVRAEIVIERARRKYPDDPVVDAFAALIFLDAGRPHRAVRVLGLALCNHAESGALEGFDTALTRKFRGATQAAAVNGAASKH